MRRRPAPAFALLAPLVLSGSLLGASAEVYGRPLRGLSAVPLADVAAHPERHRGGAIRVTGEVAEASGAKVVLSQGGASLTLQSDGSFALPPLPKGAKVTAEGKLRADAPVLAATGIEVRR